MKDYFHGEFPAQPARLAFRRPNDILRGSIMRDAAVIFFGGPDWRNIAPDLAAVPEQNRSRFVLCLFMVVLAGQVLHIYLRDSYNLWPSGTNYPNYGWSGFGPHNEDPFKILWAPALGRVVDTSKLLPLLPEFAGFHVDESRVYF